MQIGFIGLGNMGSAMARNLLRAGHSLTVFNRSRERATALGEAGAKVAATPGEAAGGAEAVFTMVADDPALQDMVFGERGLLNGLGQGAVHVSSSTVSTALARKLAKEHAGRGQKFVSAPVFGRPDAAEAKRLLVITAGEAEAIERIKPLTEAIGRQTYVVGSEPWQANAFKACGNFMISSMVEAFGEAFAVMNKAGVGERPFLDVMVELFGSPVYKNYGTIAVDRKFEPAGFVLKLGLKDIKLAIEAAGELNVPMPVASVVRDQFLSAMANGQENLDWASLALVASRNAGVTPS